MFRQQISVSGHFVYLGKYARHRLRFYFKWSGNKRITQGRPGNIPKVDFRIEPFTLSSVVGTRLVDGRVLLLLYCSLRWGGVG